MKTETQNLPDILFDKSAKILAVAKAIKIVQLSRGHILLDLNDFEIETLMNIITENANVIHSHSMDLRYNE